MLFHIFILFFLSLVNCDFGSDVSVASSAASVLASKVDACNSKSGLFGALKIRRYFPVVDKAISHLSKNAMSVRRSEIDAGQINSFAATITTLLEALSRRAEDFQAIGARWFVSRNLRLLGPPAADIVSNVYSAVSDDPVLLGSLTRGIYSLTDGFSNVNSLYYVGQVEFIDIIM